MSNLSLPTFSSFFNASLMYKRVYSGKFAGNTDAEEAFQFFWKPESIMQMICSAKNGQPALKGIVNEFEAAFSGRAAFDLNNEEVRKFCGCLVQFVIGFFGYEKSGTGTVGEAKFFRNASKYRFDRSKCLYKLVLSIEEVTDEDA